MVVQYLRSTGGKLFLDWYIMTYDTSEGIMDAQTWGTPHHVPAEVVLQGNFSVVEPVEYPIDAKNK